MSDILPGFSFSGNAPNNVVTAANLNALVGGAIIQPTVISGKAAKAMPVNDDSLLIWDSVSQTLQQVTVQALVPQASVLSGFAGLLIFNDSGSPNSVLDVVANELIMMSAAGVPRRVVSFSSSLNSFGTAGTVNGPESGSVRTASTWTYVWAISNGVTDGTLLSLSATNPTLPSGYIYSRLLGCARFDASVNFITMHQQGQSVTVNPGPQAATTGATSDQVPIISATGNNFTKQALGASAGAFAAIGIGKCVPPIAVRCRGLIGALTGGVGTASYSFLPTATVGTDSMDSTTLTNPGGLVCGVAVQHINKLWYGFASVFAFELPIAFGNGSVIYGAVDDASVWHSMRITGYDLNI